MSDTVDALLDERAKIEKLALEWGDRWLATGHGFGVVRPITFDRAEVAEHIWGTGTGRNAGLSMNQARARAGLPPIAGGPKLAIGDDCVLNSGGPIMRVIDVVGDSVVVAWRGEAMTESTFPMACVRRCALNVTGSPD